MSVVTFRHGEGSRQTGTASRSISSITAGVITTTASMTGQQVGDSLEIHTNASGNNGFYHLVAFSGSTLTVRPPPLDQGAANGTVVRLGRAIERPISASGLTSITALPGGSLAVVEVSGANFLTNEINLNDRMVLSGASGTNNGAWYVQEVLSEALIVVRPPDGGAGMGSQGASGTVSFRAGVTRIDGVVSGETELSWDWVLANVTPLSGATLYQGGGSIRDYIRRESVGGDTANAPRALYRIHGLTFLILTSGSAATSGWQSQNEYVINARHSRPGTTGDMQDFRFQLGTDAHVYLGQQTGNRYSAASGSVWIGVRIPGTQAMPMHLFASFWDGVSNLGGSQLRIASGGALTASLSPNTAIEAGVVVESMVATLFAPVCPTGIVDFANLLVTNQPAATGYTSSQTIEGLLLASDVVLPTLTVSISGAVLTLLNSREDYDLGTYVSTATANTQAEKRYTFNPRFVNPNSSDGTPIPISGASVRIFEINETTQSEVLVFSGSTNGNGLITTSGTDLRRQHSAGSTVTDYSHRLVVEGGGLRLVNQRFQMRAPVDTDFTILTIAPDYESEYDE